MFVRMWRVLTRPSFAEFENARAGASIGRAITFTLQVGLILGTLHGFVHWVSASGTVVEIVTMAMMSGLGLLAALFIVQAFQFVTAHALGGVGDFATQVYISTLVFAPLFGIVSLADIIPVIGTIVVIAAMLYFIGVNIFALRAAHGGQVWRVPNIVLAGVSMIGGVIGWLVLASIRQ